MSHFLSLTFAHTRRVTRLTQRKPSFIFEARKEDFKGELSKS